MSRSIHTTHRELATLQRWDVADPKRWKRRIKGARHAIERKRAVKAHTLRERRLPQSPAVPADPDACLVRVRDESAVVHFPASADDVRAVLRLLPPGTLNGLSRIEFCLGSRYQPAGDAAREEGCEPDPYTERLGWEMMPGVYSGRLLGTYFADDASIRLYAYVYADLPDRAWREVFLRLCMLDTLTHEVAHHVERSQRDARGRWADPSEWRRERFAEAWAHRWTLEFVVPYLERTYPEDVRALAAWVERHGGIALPLARLAYDPNEGYFPTQGAFTTLVELVDAEESPEEARLAFARDLHYAEHYDDALRIVAAVLADRSDSADALALRADIYEHQRRYDEAERDARAVIQAADVAARSATPGGEDAASDAHGAVPSAWQVLMDVYCARGEWRLLATAAGHLTDLNPDHPWRDHRAVYARGLARIELGEYEAAAADIEWLDRVRGPGARDAAVLRALLLLRTGHHAEALRRAVEYLGFRPRYRYLRGVWAAIRCEAARALGGPPRAARLTREEAEALRVHGYDEWADRLARV